MALQTELRELTTLFADAVLAALRKAPLGDLALVSGVRAVRALRPSRTPTAATARKPRRSSARLARRSPDEIAATLGKVIALVRPHREGLSAERIRNDLGLDRRELPKVFAMGFEKKTLRSKGQKRATRYFA